MHFGIWLFFDHISQIVCRPTDDAFLGNCVRLETSFFVPKFADHAIRANIGTDPRAGARMSRNSRSSLLTAAKRF
jgi:hypothetical protein